MQDKLTTKQRADLRAQVRTGAVVLAVLLLVILFVLVIAANEGAQGPGGEPQTMEEGRGTLS